MDTFYKLLVMGIS